MFKRFKLWLYGIPRYVVYSPSEEVLRAREKFKKENPQFKPRNSFIVGKTYEVVNVRRGFVEVRNECGYAATFPIETRMGNLYPYRELFREGV